jgi:serine/threonine protein kinase
LRATNAFKRTAHYRIVAIKILPPHLSNNPEAKQRFDREARAISSLNHPNICTLFDVGHGVLYAFNFVLQST